MMLVFILIVVNVSKITSKAHCQCMGHMQEKSWCAIMTTGMMAQCSIYTTTLPARVIAKAQAFAVCDPESPEEKNGLLTLTLDGALLSCPLPCHFLEWNNYGSFSHPSPLSENCLIHLHFHPKL